MTAEKKKGKAHSYDLDDTLIGRESITRGIGAVAGAFRSHQLPEYNASNLPVIIRQTSDKPLSSLSERVSFRVHERRDVLPGVQNIIQQDRKNNIDIYGNTGRSNKKAWVEMTRKTLERGGINSFFRDVYFTPDGIKTAVSKAVALKELLQTYEEVSHFEDDPRTAAYLASLFPDIDVYLIHYGSTGLLYSREEISRFPNIYRIGCLEEAGK